MARVRRHNGCYSNFFFVCTVTYFASYIAAFMVSVSILSMDSNRLVNKVDWKISTLLSIKSGLELVISTFLCFLELRGKKLFIIWIITRGGFIGYLIFIYSYVINNLHFGFSELCRWARGILPYLTFLDLLMLCVVIYGVHKRLFHGVATGTRVDGNQESLTVGNSTNEDEEGPEAESSSSKIYAINAENPQYEQPKEKCRRICGDYIEETKV